LSPRRSLKDGSVRYERAGTSFKLEDGPDARCVEGAIARARSAHESVASQVTLDRVVVALRADTTTLPAPAAPLVAPLVAPGPVAAEAVPSEARALAEKFAALKSAEAERARIEAVPASPVGAGESEQLAELLGGAAPDV